MFLLEVFDLELVVKSKFEPAQSHLSSWEDLSNR